MARRATLTHDALISLGPEKLARLILDEAGRNSAFKRLVTAALAATHGPEAVAAVVDGRLSALERARGPIAWEKRKAFVSDLEATLKTITDELGAADSAAAVERILRFLAGAESVFERVDDSSGSVQEVYHAAAEAAPGLTANLSDDQKARLPSRIMPLLAADRYGLIGRVVDALVPLLPPDANLRFDAALAAAVQEIGPTREDTRDWERQARRDRLIRARQAIADYRGDVDAFMALEQERSGQCQDSLAIAERLLGSGRASEALDWVRRPTRPGLRVMTWHDMGDGSGGQDRSARQRIALEVRILEAIGDRDAAQALRWQSFEATLDASMLRDYLAHLPDFAEFEALDRAFDTLADYRGDFAVEDFVLYAHDPDQGWRRHAAFRLQGS